MKQPHKYTQKTPISDWSYSDKRALALRVFRWCKSNMGVNMRNPFAVSLSVVKNQYEPKTYGAFDAEINELILYYNNVKSLKVLITTIIHEYQHSLQPIKTKYEVYSKKYGYWKNPLEVEARNAEKKYFKEVLAYLNKTNKK